MKVVLIYVCLASIAIDAIDPTWYIYGYRDSFKVLPLNLSNTNIILSSPHAGSEMPDDVPDRTIGGCRRLNSSVCTFDYVDSCLNGQRCISTTVQDFACFDPFTEQVAEELYRTYNLIPLVVVAGWNRKKIDFNREVNEATFNHPEAIKAYRGYHKYLKKAVRRIERRFNGKGLLLDIHQHAQGK
jgi:N-formylglutamate amidohydrolase